MLLPVYFLKQNLSKYQTMIISKQELDGLDVLIDGMAMLLKLLNNARHHY